MNFVEVEAVFPDATFGKVSLQDSKGSNIFILFYPGDFWTVSRQEIEELTNLIEDFEALKCKVFACAATSAQMHHTWMLTIPEDEHEGLGFRPKFPLLADENNSLCKTFDMFDEEQGRAKHGFVLLNEAGLVKYKEIIDQETRLHIDDALSTVKRSILFAEIKEKVKQGENSDDDEDLPEPPALPEEDGEAENFHHHIIDPELVVKTEALPEELISPLDGADKPEETSKQETSETSVEEKSVEPMNTAESETQGQIEHEETDDTKSLSDASTVVGREQSSEVHHKMAEIQSLDDELQEIQEHPPTPSYEPKVSEEIKFDESIAPVLEISQTPAREDGNVSVEELEKKLKSELSMKKKETEPTSTTATPSAEHVDGNKKAKKSKPCCSIA